MKKLLTMMLMLVAGTAMSFADYYVVGDFTTWTSKPVTDEVPAMKLLEGTTDTYYADYKPAEGDIYFCIADGDGAGDDWSDFNANHRYSQGTANYGVTNGCYGVDGVHGDFSLKIEADGSTTYRIMFVESTKKITVTKVGLEYVVAGCIDTDDKAGFFGAAWSPTAAANKLTLQTDGTYAITYTDVELDPCTIIFKVTNSDWSSETYSNQSKAIAKKSKYDITFVFYINNIDGPVCKVEEKFTGYYLITNASGSWEQGDALTDSGSGDYSVTFTNEGYMFAIAPNTALAADGTVADWTNVVRPVTEGGDWEVTYFVNYSGDTQSVTSGGKVWSVPAGNASNLTLSYDPDDNKFYISTDAYETVTIGTTGYATYSNAAAYKVIGTEAEVYIVTAASTAATLTKLATEAEIPAGTGVIIKGDADSYTIEPSDGTADVTGNMLIGSGNYTYNITGTYPDESSYTGYILANGTKGVGFYQLNPTYKTLAAHKAFLAVSSVGAPEFIAFGGDATGVEAVEKAESMKNAEFYNLAGQRVAQPTKGLYIVNGKKVIVK